MTVRTHVDIILGYGRATIYGETMLSKVLLNLIHHALL